MSADLDKSHEVALVQVGEDALGPQKKQVGLNHMARMMSSLADLKQLYQRLKDKGGPIKRISDHGIPIAIYFEDPDGNGLEVCASRRGSSGLVRSSYSRRTSWSLAVSLARGRGPGRTLGRSLAPLRCFSAQL